MAGPDGSPAPVLVAASARGRRPGRLPGPIRLPGPGWAARGPYEPSVGLVLARTGRAEGCGAFWTPFVAGLTAGLAARGVALRLGLAAGDAQEIAMQRAWWRGGQIAGAVVVDLRTRDERLPARRGLGMPLVVAGPPGPAGALPAEWTDDEAAMDAAVRYLAALGHRRIARVAHDPRLAHTALRTAAFTRVSAGLGLAHTTVATGPGDPDPGRATRELLLSPSRPTAVIHDSTGAALAALGAAAGLGIAVPAGLSVLAWDDAPACQVSRPALSVVRHDVYAYGQRTAHTALRALAGLPPVPRARAVPVLRPRASTGVPRAGTPPPAP
jgi:DNA-binding LacI/PurR family transcriptional regulator